MRLSPCGWRNGRTPAPRDEVAPPHTCLPSPQGNIVAALLGVLEGAAGSKVRDAERLQVRVGSFSTDPAGPDCRFTSALPQKQNPKYQVGWDANGMDRPCSRPEDDRGLRSTRSTSLCPIRQPLQSLTPLASIQARTPCI